MRWVVAVVLLVSACAAEPSGVSSPVVVPPTEPPATMAAKPRSGTTITTYDSQFGPMLFDSSGQAIYLFDLEPTTQPRCYDDCAEAWPPVLTNGLPRASGRVREGLLGTTRRSDGTTQVTYKGHPLYFYAHEGKRQVLCHDIEEYGGLWLVVQPDGDPAPSS